MHLVIKKLAGGELLIKTITEEPLKGDLNNYWRCLIGNGAYIFRPYTKFTAEWYAETKKRVTRKGRLLHKRKLS